MRRIWATLDSGRRYGHKRNADADVSESQFNSDERDIYTHQSSRELKKKLLCSVLLYVRCTWSSHICTTEAENNILFFIARKERIFKVHHSHRSKSTSFYSILVITLRLETSIFFPRFLVFRKISYSRNRKVSVLCSVFDVRCSVSGFRFQVSGLSDGHRT